MLHHPTQLVTLVNTAVNTLIVLGSISGFFGNLYQEMQEAIMMQYVRKARK